VLRSLLAFVTRHQRRLARLVLVMGAAYAGLELWPSWPREAEIEFLLGTSHADVVELRVAYVKDEQALHGVTFTFPQGAPAQVRHRVTLPAGTFVAHCELFRRAGGPREVTRVFQVPTAGPVRIPLVSDATALLRRLATRHRVPA
jgi:hypothetical protein